MKRIKITLDWSILGILVLPFLYAAAHWEEIPARVVSHYNFRGEPDATQPKELFFLLLAGIQLLVYLLLRYVPGAGVFANTQPVTYQRLRFVVTLFLSALFGWLTYTAINPGPAPGGRWLFFGIMLLLVAMGNYMPSLRPNFFVGIRTPWTLFSEKVWRKTHQLAGRLWVGGGLLGVVLLGILPEAWRLYVLLSITALLVLIPTVYSYLMFREEKRRLI